MHGINIAFDRGGDGAGRGRGAMFSSEFAGEIREMLTATAMGYFEAEIAKAVVLALFVPFIISSGVVGVVLWGTLIGSLLPFVLRRPGFDPATSSAPFVATLVDVTGLVIYFSSSSCAERCYESMPARV
jgi:Mg/Co/Ni transporter MgtE